MHKEILPLTTLRFATALLVFLFHIQIYWQLIPFGRSAQFLQMGACGMSMFFMLSGFVLAYRHKEGIVTLKQYVFGRFSRIYPVYFLSGLVTVPWLIFSLSDYHSFMGLRYFFMAFINIFMIQAWIPQVFTFWNDGGSWSLSVEMFLYAMFPLVINKIRFLSAQQLYILLLILYITTSIPGISWILFNKGGNLIIFYSIPIFRLSEFMIGMICGLMFARGLRISGANVFTLVCALLIYVSLSHFPLSLGSAFVSTNFIVIPLFAFLLLSVASVSQGFLSRLLANRLLVYLGRISYSFYAFQALILMTLLTGRAKINSLLPMMANKYVLLVVSFSGLTAIAAISYYFVETKLRRFLENKFKARTEYQLKYDNIEPVAG